jgi:hypothetical protein
VGSTGVEESYRTIKEKETQTMTQMTLQEVATFLDCYRTVTFAQRSERILTGYSDAQTKSRRTAPHFNIFKILGVDRREVKTHSAFLANLLDPQGLHGQGHLFLGTFLNHCHGKELTRVGAAHECPLLPLPDCAIEKYEWYVNREYCTKGSGNLDIIIRCRELKYLCVIENKVDAGEGENRLQIYYDWMSAQPDYSHRVLIFLTPAGKPSYTISNGAYHRLSYHKDIYEWLTAALPEVKASSVKSVVEQYKDLAVEL